MIEEITDQENLSRLRWQCRRGMLELDELLEGFLNKTYVNMSAEQKQTSKQSSICPINSCLIIY